jgi:serine/threonine-protein kinase
MLETIEIGGGSVLAGRYRVVERIGAGGMATVYLAEDQVLGRHVAVKRMRSESPDSDAARFRREARLGATLSHPNLVTIFDTVAGEDGVLIVMEHVEGETLADVLARGRLEPDQATEVLRGVASALDHAHGQGIVHRDVKPANVLVGADGTVKLTDLGIATAAEETRITNIHDIVGTLAYISPERLEAESPGGPPADVYSLGVLAYEVLTGEQLNRGSTPAEVLYRAASGPPPDLRAAWPGAPEALVRALQRAMDPDPSLRPPSAGALVDEIEAALADTEPVVPPTERMALPDEPRPPERPPASVLSARPPSASPPARPAAQGRRPHAALLAMLALGSAGLIALGIAILGGGEENRGGGQGDGEAAAASGEAEGSQAATEGAAPAPAPAEEADPATGAALNDQGFALIQEGRYDEAIPVLEQAVRSFPEGTGDLDYAYALYNLGNALRLAGRPEEAIPVLERRLEIPDQTETVQRELDLARAEAGYSPSGKEPKPPKAPKPPKPEE